MLAIRAGGYHAGELNPHYAPTGLRVTRSIMKELSTVESFKLAENLIWWLPGAIAVVPMRISCQPEVFGKTVPRFTYWS